MKKHLRLIPAFAFGMAFLSISTLANAEVILNVTQGNLIAKGAGVELSVQVTCNQSLGNSSLTFGGILTQRVGNGITNGEVSGSQQLTCTGTAQTIEILAVGNNPGKPFRKGPAIINMNVSLFSQDTTDFDGGHTLQETQIVR